MIYGIGTDIIEISRFENTTESFLNKVYTKKEQVLLKNKAESLAGNFAAKEAVAKALVTGFRGFGAKDIEILRSDLGAPTVTLYNNALSLFNEKNCKKIYITISHNKTTACAFAVIEGDD